MSIELGVEIIATGELVGDAMLAWVSCAHQCGEVSYVFNPKSAGHGCATEATDELLRLGFNELGLHRVIARIVAGNARSLALAERLGMRREAHLVESWRRDGEWLNEIQLAILRSE